MCCCLETQLDAESVDSSSGLRTIMFWCPSTTLPPSNCVAVLSCPRPSLRRQMGKGFGDMLPSWCGGKATAVFKALAAKVSIVSWNGQIWRHVQDAGGLWSDLMWPKCQIRCNRMHWSCKSRWVQIFCHWSQQLGDHHPAASLSGRV